MHDGLAELFDRQGGVATTAQILALVSRRYLDNLLDCAALERIWRGVYGRGDLDESLRLRGLDVSCGEEVVMCLATAARAHGFDTEGGSTLHVLNPLRHQLRPADGLVIHRREGAPLSRVLARPATAPAWTAIEVARGLRRPRALATLDAALRSGTCDRVDLVRASAAQAGRRGIVKVRALLPLADGLAEYGNQRILVEVDRTLKEANRLQKIMITNAKLPNIDVVDYWTTDKLLPTLETHRRALVPNIQERIRIFPLPEEVNF